MNLRILRNPKVNLTAATIVAVTAFAAGAIYINQTPPTQRLQTASDVQPSSTPQGTPSDPSAGSTAGATSEPQTGSTSSSTAPSAPNTEPGTETASGAPQTDDTTDQVLAVVAVSAVEDNIWSTPQSIAPQECESNEDGTPFKYCPATAQYDSCVWTYSDGSTRQEQFEEIITITGPISSISSEGKGLVPGSVPCTVANAPAAN